jgi:hypothetical protein
MTRSGADLRVLSKVVFDDLYLERRDRRET